MAGGEGDGGYWPGYVDAMSNLVLTLLFVVTIMSLVIFVVSLEAGKKAAMAAMGEQMSKAVSQMQTAEPQEKLDAPEMKELSEENGVLKRKVEQLEKRLADAKVQDNQAQIRVKGENISIAKAETLIEREKSVEANTEDTLKITFLLQALSISPIAKENLDKSTALRDMATPGKQITLQSRVGAGALSEQRRHAYFRLMAVRTYLIEKGMRPTDIKTVIDESANAPSEPNIVRIFPGNK